MSVFPYRIKLGAAAAALSLAWAPAQALDYTYQPSQYRHLVILAEGRIEEDEAQRFLQFIETLPSEMRQIFNDADGNAVIRFDSGGGYLKGADALARIVLGHRLMTSVVPGARCASACVVVWAAGVRKVIGLGARIGVHNAKSNGPGNKASEQVIDDAVTGLMAGWLVRDGAPANVLKQTMNTPSYGMYWLTDEDLAAWGVVR